MPDSHEHIHDIIIRRKKGILWGILLNFGFSLIELAAGLFTASLAVISSALHDFSDAFSFVLSYWGITFDHKAPTKRFTFGFHKVPIFIAFVNALVLIVITLGIIANAWKRLRSPVSVSNSLVIIGIAALGIIVNGVATFLLSRDRKNLNIRAAMLHLAGDFAGWFLVLAMGIILRFTNWYFLDPAITLLVSAAILWESVKVIKEGTEILLDITPRGIDFDKVAEFIRSASPLIENVHDLHIWQMGEEQFSLSVHIVVKQKLLGHYHKLLSDLRRDLGKHFGITHAVVEMECPECGTEICTPEK